MSDFDKLDAALNAYEQARKVKNGAADSQKTEKERFIAEVSNLLFIEVHQQLQFVGERLAAKGHDYDISRGDDVSQPSITLNFYRAGIETRASTYYESADHPRFTATGNPSSRMVDLTSTLKDQGIVAETHLGEHNLSDNTALLVREAAIDFVTKALRAA